MSQIDSRAGRMAQLLIEGTGVGKAQTVFAERFMSEANAAAPKGRGPTR